MTQFETGFGCAHWSVSKDIVNKQKKNNTRGYTQNYSSVKLVKVHQTKKTRFTVNCEKR